MPSPHPDPPHWVRAGRTYGLVVAGRIEALVYWSEPDVAELDGPGGEPVVTDGDWVWVAVDDPGNHWVLPDAPELSADVRYDEQVATTEDALEQASRAIMAYLEGRR